MSALEPAEEITPFNVRTCPVEALIVAGPVSEIALFKVIKGPADWSVTVFKATEPAPKALLLLTNTVAPFVTVVLPEIALF